MSEISTTMSNNNMMIEFKKIFKCEYFTTENKKLFNDIIPFGWFECDGNLFIINYEYYTEYKSRSLRQATKCYNIAKETEEFKKYTNCYLVVGYGTKPLKYEIYSTINDNITLTKKTLEDFKTIKNNIAHTFNQYLQDNNINIPNNIKIFFVISILLCRKANPKIISFLNENENNDGFIITKYLDELLNKFYKDELITRRFKFMDYNLNNKHLYNLIKMLNFNIKDYSNDIINQFYSEFIEQNKKEDEEKSEKKNILTPYDIVELMVRELNIKKGESIADFCTGIGSFLIEASKYTDNLIGCEDKEDLYTIAKSNFILHDLNTDKLYYNNCFNQKFEMYDHIILNPPYGIRNEIYREYEKQFYIEHEYIIYQLQYLKENGTGCFIIPSYNLDNSNEKINKFKKVLLDKYQILKIFECNDKIFYPNNSNYYTIIVFKKCNYKILTEIINYNKDGYIIENNKRVKKTKPIIKSYKKFLDYKDYWYYINYNIILPDVNFIFYTLKINEYSTRHNMYMLEKDYSTMSFEGKCFVNEINTLDDIKFKYYIKVNIGKYFNIINNYKGYIEKSKSGVFPLIPPLVTIPACINGISMYMDNYYLNGDYLIIAPNGSSGATFHQEGMFAVDKQIKVLQLKKDKKLKLDLFAVCCDYFLKQKYSYTNCLTEEKILQEVIYYPIVEFTE